MYQIAPSYDSTKSLPVSYTHLVGNVVVGKHDAFRASRSAGGVLHVHYIVASDLTFELIQATVFYIVAQEKYFGRV